MSAVDHERDFRRDDDDKQPPACARCGETARVAIKLFDPRTGRDVPVYRCRCGELIWKD